MIAAIVTLAAEAAVIGVVAGMMLAWGLSGGDGVDAHPVAALLGVVLFVGTIATTGVVIGLFVGWTGPAVILTVALTGVGATAWLSWQPPERGRRPLFIVLAGVASILPVMVGLMGEAQAAAPHHLLIGAVAPVALVLALVPPWGDRPARRDPLLLAALLTLAAPLLLLATTTVV